MTSWLTAVLRAPAVRAALRDLLVAAIAVVLAATGDVRLLDGQLGPAVGQAVLALSGL